MVRYYDDSESLEYMQPGAGGNGWQSAARDSQMNAIPQVSQQVEQDLLGFLDSVPRLNMGQAQVLEQMSGHMYDQSLSAKDREKLLKDDIKLMEKVTPDMTKVQKMHLSEMKRDLKNDVKFEEKTGYSIAVMRSDFQAYGPSDVANVGYSPGDFRPALAPPGMQNADGYYRGYSTDMRSYTGDVNAFMRPGGYMDLQGYMNTLPMNFGRTGNMGYGTFQSDASYGQVVEEGKKNGSGWKTALKIGGTIALVACGLGVFGAIPQLAAGAVKFAGLAWSGAKHVGKAIGGALKGIGNGLKKIFSF